MTLAPPLLDRFYPIVPDCAWLARLAPLGVRTVQLRVKDQPVDRVRSEIETSVSIARQTGIQLIVNDYWREAIAAGADFVHLGQEDLATADVAEIKRAGLRLGISTHNEAELRKHIGVQLQINAVLQPQHLEFVLGEFAGQPALHLVAKLRDAFVDERAVEFVICIHG